MADHTKKYQTVKKVLKLREDIADITPYTVTLPDPPPLHEIQGWGLPIEDQVFTREVIPDWVWALTRLSKKKGKRGEVYDIVNKTPEYADFVEDQWRKRLTGVWQYIHGVPTFIPGNYWYFLNYYYLDVGLPDYKNVDLEYFYWWNYCVVENPRVYGGIEIAPRRDGKTYRGLSNVLEFITRTRMANAGIQSKTDADAKDAFQNKVILQLRAMPFYFSPISDSKAYPTKEINFRDGGEEEDRVGGKSKELNSWIEARPTVFSAFDSTKLKRYFLDEPGKTTEMMVSQAWRVHKHCLRVGTKIIGKALLTTTVEETVKGGLDEYVKIWAESDHAPDKLQENGQTKSGLVRYFKSAYETIRTGKYGESIIGKPTPAQEAWLISQGEIDPHKGGKQLVDEMRNASDDPEERVKQKRLLPTTVREALSASSKDCEFNPEILEKRLEDFRFGNYEMESGNLEWKDHEPDTEVIWKPCKDGRWRIRKYLVPYLLQRANKVNIINGSRYPGNKGAGAVGADPYAYDATIEERKSLGTAHYFMNLDLDIEEAHMEYCEENTDEYGNPLVYKRLTNHLVIEYGYRHMNKAKYGEDMIKMCVFLGVDMFPEVNIAFLWDYLTSRGYEKFLKYRKVFRKKEGKMKLQDSATPGASTKAGGLKEALFAFTGNYIEESGMGCACHEFLKDCQNVGYNDMSPYDYAVSGMYAIYACKMVNRIKKLDSGKKQSFDGMWTPRAYG